MWNLLANEEVNTDIQTLANTINGIVFALLGLIAVGVIILAVWIGFKMATATDDSKRKDAKMQLIYCVVGVIAVILIIVLWQTVISDVIRNALRDARTG